MVYQVWKSETCGLLVADLARFHLTRSYGHTVTNHWNNSDMPTLHHLHTNFHANARLPQLGVALEGRWEITHCSQYICSTLMS